jgi:hypothetical protein
MMPFDAFVLQMRNTSSGETLATELVLRPRGDIAAGINAGWAEVHAWIINVHEFQEFGPERRDSILLDDGEWMAEILPLPDIKNRTRKLKETGGFAVTHAIRLTRTDGRLFDWASAKPPLERLVWFLSFACGRHVGLAYPQALAPDGTTIWNCYSVDYVDAWKGVRSAFDVHHGEMLRILWPAFARNHSIDAFRRAVYWYIKANYIEAGADGSIILIQAALEILPFHVLVTERGALDSNGFEKVKAVNRIRLLLDRIGVPLTIPPELKLTGTSAKSNNWDGPNTLVSARNALVHPGGQNKPTPPETEVLTLGLHYGELILLGLCGYNGSYSKRCKNSHIGEVEPVPWVRTRIS